MDSYGYYIQEEKECYRKFDKIMCVSEEVKNRFSEKTGIKENLKIQINPIDSKQILSRANEKIEKDLNKNGYIVCTVGRLVKEKGFDRLLEVHKRLLQESIVHTLWIVGEGQERKNLEDYIKNNHLELTVNLIGYDENPYKYVKNSNIFVCSSKIEGLSSAVLEATILEKIIVSTNCPGTKEILGSDGQSGMIVDNDTESLYKGLKAVLTDPSLRDKYAKNIKERSKLVNIDTVISQIEKILDEE